MRNYLIFIVVVALTLLAADYAAEPLPEPISNNAVTMLKLHNDYEIFSLMGIGSKKTWDSVSNVSYEISASSGKADTIHPVPGTVGRIGASATAASGHLYVFGGYVLYQGGGTVVPDANAYEPANDRWVRLADIPTPVGDAVIGVYRDRYVYLVGGRAAGGPIADVQVFDIEKNRWLKANAPPGAGVFGHAGGMVDDTIIFIDGARRGDPGGPRFVASEDCWKGKIDHHHPTNIQWTKLPNHPGDARFGIAAGAAEKEEKIYFSGGSASPHDFAGMGFDGKPAEPSPVTFAFNLRSEKWETLDTKTPNPTMDHHELVVTPEGLVIVGGMESGQKVTDRIAVLSKEPKAK